MREQTKFVVNGGKTNNIFYFSVVNVDIKEGCVTVRNPTAEKSDQPKKVFNFERVYDSK